MGNPTVRADAGRFPHRVAARIARAIRSARFRGEGGPSPAALRAASVPGGLSTQPSRTQHPRSRRAALLLSLGAGACAPDPADLLILGGDIHDGGGGAPFVADLAVTGDEIVFVGDAAAAGITAAETLDGSGLLVAPGFVDMHSHSQIGADWGREALPFLHQGITTVVLGVDGGGVPEVAETLAGWEERGIGVNALTYVGHGAVRRRVLGSEDRAPTPAELDAMRALVRKGLEEGAFGLSSGLFYVPGTYAETEEVIELARVAAEFAPGIYDTHDRDLGASYPSFGYLASIAEAIRIGEESGTKVIFSHFNAQGARNYGRAPEGAALVEAARERGVPVFAAQHVYTATQSSLRAYTVPRWASAGGREAMLERFRDPEVARVLDEATAEMLAIRGGAEKIRFSDPRPELNGRTLAEVADELGVPPPEAARRILVEGNASVMNIGLYDPVNTAFLAEQDWMMTCTDGRDIEPGTAVGHPRVYGAFTKKLRDHVLDAERISMPFAIRSMTGLAAEFLGIGDRGRLAPGMKADLAVLDPERIRDRATYDDPHRFSEGTVHVLVNGVFAIREGVATGALAGRALRP